MHANIFKRSLLVFLKSWRIYLEAKWQWVVLNGIAVKLKRTPEADFWLLWWSNNDFFMSGMKFKLEFKIAIAREKKFIWGFSQPLRWTKTIFISHLRSKRENCENSRLLRVLLRKTKIFCRSRPKQQLDAMWQNQTINKLFQREIEMKIDLRQLVGKQVWFMVG